MGRARRQIQRRRRAREILNGVMSNPEHVVVIHYSCESFYDRPDGSSPRITSIAAANLETAQTSSFSIHQVAEREGIPIEKISENYDRLEKLMLDEFYDYAKSHTGYKWLHWNMRNIHYGFKAIEHRYKVLGGQPTEIYEGNLVDLARLIYAIYGPRYIGHPRMEKLIERNRISQKDFITGAEEAEAFEKGDYVKLHFSTLRKVDNFATIAQRADEGTLKTNSGWKDIYGFYPQAVAEWLNENWWARILEFAFAVLGFIATAIQILEWIGK